MNILEIKVQNKLFRISECDKEFFDSKKWYLINGGKVKEKWYLLANHKGKTIYFHREIISAKKGDYADHKDGNTFNCTRENMRIATPSESRLNASKSLIKTYTKYKGVFKKKETSKTFCSAIRVNGKSIYLGSFNTDVEAHNAYENKRIELGL